MSATNADTVNLRRMREDEYDAFLERSVREYADELAESLGVEAAQTRPKAEQVIGELLPDGLRSDGQHVFVIEHDGAPVGELWFGMRDQPAGTEAFGYDFWIRPELRDRGIGRHAMRRAAEVARELGAVRLMLNVFGDNERARHLYESFGFRVTSTNMAMDLPVAD